MALKASRTTDTRKLKRQLKKKAGGDYLARIPGDGSLVMRIATEPSEWIKFTEHYDENAEPRYFPCQDSGCNGCSNLTDRPSERYLIAGVDRETNQMMPLVIPKSAAKFLYRYWENYGTLLDRDYDLSREGTGFDTEYSVTPESPSTFKQLGGMEVPDLMEVLATQLGEDDEDEDAEEDEEDDDDLPEALRPPAPSIKKRRVATRGIESSPVKKKRRVI